MAFEPAKIKKQHIFEAVKKIENEKIRLHPSIGYDVIINGKHYPPKEIIRISYKLAVGEEPGQLYGGEQVNSVLKNLGFEVIQKIAIWKLGCNWGRGAPSFYNFIHQESIVIGEQSFNYQPGDLVIITEGFTVHAIAKILEKVKPITSNKNYEIQCNKYEIDFNDNVTYAKAEWFELSKTDIFIYELQQGIRKVQKQDIRERVINLWENKEFQVSNIIFYNTNYRDISKEYWIYPCLSISKNSWDDYGFQTTFELINHKSINEKVEIGFVKILENGKNSTATPPFFESLNRNYYSLGMTIDYYKRLKLEFPKAYIDILRALNDSAFFGEPKEALKNLPGFQVSLLRSTEAQLAFYKAKSIIEETEKEKVSNFLFEFKFEEAVESHKVDFSFNANQDLPNNFFCIVGKNGTGKTKFISQLANKLSNNSEEGIFHPDRPFFTKIIAASFSYFDKFKFPEKRDISYEFIGIKSRDGLLLEKDIEHIVWDAYKIISEDRKRKTIWEKSISTSLEKEYLNYNLNEFSSISTRKDFNQRTEDIFSSGQKIIFHFITRFLSIIDDHSLLIFDEPETHLHPNIAGRLLRTINSILDEYSSYCIISTHSPIIIQEIPSMFIRIFDRYENFPLIYKPTIECFGENLSNISNSIFRADEEKELYKIVLEKLALKHSMREIEEIFEKKLSLNSLLFIQTLIKGKND